MRFRIVNTDGRGANLRPTPNTRSAPIGALPEGARITGDEHAWRSVSDSAGNQGFVADESLVASGNAVHVGNTDGLGANLRAQPDIRAPIVLALPAGTQLASAPGLVARCGPPRAAAAAAVASPPV